MYYFILDDVESHKMNLKVTKRPNFPAPQKRYQKYNIPGRNGTLYEDLETYEDINIEIKMNYISDPQSWHYKWREVKKWIFKKGLRKLVLSDNQDYYYLVKKIELTDNERKVRKSGEFTIILTCEVYSYLIEGSWSYPIYTNVVDNDYETTTPKYIIKGEGMCHLVVNGTDCICNVGQNLVIDTYLELSYREDGTLQNTSINADYRDLYLVEGENTITITDGFDLEIVPNWRCL